MKFNVTYEIVSHESAAEGEAEDQGFVAEDVSLRDAIQEVGGSASEPSDSRISSARWFTNSEYAECMHSGDRESRSLHIPKGVTASSRLRIARLLGVRNA